MVLAAVLPSLVKIAMWSFLFVLYEMVMVGIADLQYPVDCRNNIRPDTQKKGFVLSYSKIFTRDNYEKGCGIDAAKVRHFTTRHRVAFQHMKNLPWLPVCPIAKRSRLVICQVMQRRSC